ncbi:uncharacterized protein LOC118414037 [Branchiostoma floridae]|uniref:Uncharacterized protein LOC118414037 n=1 Tax=Branchiostoma floridae TaxID=7739 RepID=A0A9J7L032_BRAFL|nr:uncharacterized protein LOC118414037 [Branchiostoma floridae]
MSTSMSIKLAILVLILSSKLTTQNATCPSTFECSKKPNSCLTYHNRGHLHFIPSPLPLALTRLSIRYQNIINIKVGDFPILKSFQSLRLRESGVARIQPASFAGLPCLIELNLSGNNVSNLKADTFKGLYNLRVLDLSKNMIYFVDKAAFAGIGQLEILVLNNNCLSSIPQSITLLESLRQLNFLNNIKTSPLLVEDLKRLFVLIMDINKIGCDCREREAKKWLIESPHTLRWRAVCIDEATGHMKPLKDIPWTDLTCSAPQVSVLLDSPVTNVTGNISVICQTNCEESLTFSWILPSGEHSSSDYLYSTNYSHVRTMPCKGSEVEISETKRMCHSVLNIPVADNTTAGNYTCRVATNYTESATASVVLTISSAARLPDNVVTTGLENIDGSTAKTTTVMYMILLHGEDNWNESGLSANAVLWTGLVTFFCCCLMFGLSQLCFIKCRSVSEDNTGHSDTVERQYENADQFSDGTHDTSRRENEDQFPDSNNDTNRHYENDDQFSDGNEDTNRHYENDDQHPGSNYDTNRHYENDDQFSDATKNANRHNENNDQFPDSNNDTTRHNENGNENSKGHYENDDQFPDTTKVANGHYENDDQFSFEVGAKKRPNENGDQFVDEEKTLGIHYDNEIGAKSAFKASPPYEAPVAVQEMTSAVYNTTYISPEEQQGQIVQIEGQVIANNPAQEYVTFPDSQKTAEKQ